MKTTKYKIIKISGILTVIFLISTLFFLSSCGGMMGGGMMGMMGGCGMGGHSGHSMNSMNSGHKMQNNTTIESELIRKGKIDVFEIDANKDGYVFQDQMDWNVISDSAGQCPICGMNLVKISNENAVKNLENHGFETKK